MQVIDPPDGGGMGGSLNPKAAISADNDGLSLDRKIRKVTTYTITGAPLAATSEAKSDSSALESSLAGFLAKKDGLTQKIEIKIEEEKSWTWSSQDTIALCSGLIAAAFTWAMIAGTVPFNEYTVSIVTLSTISAVAFGGVSARNRRRARKSRPIKK